MEEKGKLSVRGIASIVSEEMEKRGLCERLFLVIHNRRENNYFGEVAVHSAKGCLGRFKIYDKEIRMEINYSVQDLNLGIRDSISRQTSYEIKVEDLLERTR